MKEWYIGFSGFCTIEAETKEEAEDMFWKDLQVPTKNGYDDYYDIESIELKNMEED